MAGIGGSIEAEVKQMAQEEVNRIADEVLEKLVKEVEVAMASYYENLGPGVLYERTWQFFDAYSEINNRSADQAVVGIDFNQPVNYAVHGVDVETIYDHNLEGDHGVLGNSGSILQDIDDYAAFLSD